MTVSQRTLQKDSAELKRRSEKDYVLVPLDKIFNRLQNIIKDS
jgi:hypothetical protein